MDFVTAARSVDLLLEGRRARERLNVVFFGGEPLTNVPLINRSRRYAEAEAKRAGKAIDFSLTTNATLLTPKLIDLLRCASLRDFGVHGRPEGVARSASQERRGAGNLRCRRPESADAARSVSLAAGGGEGHLGRRQHRGGGHPRAFAGRARLPRGRICAGHLGRRGRSRPVGVRTRRGSSRVREIGGGLSARGLAGRQQRLLEHASVDDGLARGQAQIAPLRRRRRVARRGRGGGSEPLSSLHGVGHAEVRERHRRYRQRTARRFHREGDRPGGDSLRDLPHPQSLRRRLLSRIVCALRRRPSSNLPLL